VPNRSPTQSARLSNIARAVAGGADVGFFSRRVNQVQPSHEEVAASYQNAWNAGRIRWSEIPAQYREVK